MKQESGFSMFELVFVILILTALVLISLGGWANFIPGYRLNAAAGELQGALQMAKLRAIKENAIVTVNLTGGTGTTPITYVAFADFDGDGNEDADDIVILTDTFHVSLARDPNDSSTQIQFNARGFPVAASSFLLVNNMEGRGVDVNVAGGTTLQESSDGGATWQDLTF